MRRLAFALCLLATPAFADDDSSYSHKHQVGLSLRTGIGVSATIPYKSTVYCGASDSSTMSGNAAVCTERAPIELGLELSYGVAAAVELTLGFSFGLEHDFGAIAGMQGPIPIQLTPGARFYFSETARSKLFVQPQLVFDFSDYKDPGGASRGTDFAVGALEGYLVDFNRHVGGYVFLGETIGFVRWLSGDFEVGIGIQARYP
ncbi:MAG TPA: hypothetical protein VGL61_33410 [Kofleriaceae bacterium]|jgi:hypothetical protein